jgi:hypothetical protein
MITSAPTVPWAEAGGVAVTRVVVSPIAPAIRRLLIRHFLCAARLRIAFVGLCRTDCGPFPYVFLFALEFLDLGPKFFRTQRSAFFSRLSMFDKAIDQQILNFSDPCAFSWRESLVLFQ